MKSFIVAIIFLVGNTLTNADPKSPPAAEWICPDNPIPFCGNIVNPSGKLIPSE